MRALLALVIAGAAAPAAATLNILACTPEWGALAKELAGDKASVHVATTAMQDPHRIEARPSLIARARSADLLVCTGAELEVGWLPLLQSQSGNARIQVGQPGYLEAAGVVELLEKPARLDRAMGDVHAGGNPHLHLDPRNVAKVATALSERMATLDPVNASHYESRGKSFFERWAEAMARWEREAAPLKGVSVVTYHKSFPYLLQWLGMREVGTLEPKPGLPPSTAHLGELVAALKREPARAILRTPYNDPRPAQWLAQHTGIASIALPYTVGGSERAKDLFGLFDDTLARLNAAAR